MGVQFLLLKCLGHTESIEDAADAVDAETPEGTLAVLLHQPLEALQLVGSSWVELEFAALPARPGIGGYAEELGHLGLRPLTERTPQIDQVQIHVAGAHRSIRHV
jgi:hypothetical protein